jgi:SAM-dependent methyltransferase
MAHEQEKQKYDKSYYYGKNSNYVFGYRNMRLELFWNRRLRILNRFADSGRLLDAGCAFGYFMKRLEKKFDVYGIDISEYAVSETRKLIERPEHAVCGDVQEHVPFSEPFDVITAFDIIEHLSDPRAALISIEKALKDGGLLYLEIPLAETLINRDIAHYYKPLEEWKQMLYDMGFRPRFMQTYYTIGFRIVMIPTHRFVNYCAIVAEKAR